MEITDNIHAAELMHLLSSFDIFSSVHEPTQNRIGQLDIIITQSDSVASNDNISEVGWPDHCLITSYLPMKPTWMEMVQAEERSGNGFVWTGSKMTSSSRCCVGIFLGLQRRRLTIYLTFTHRKLRAYLT